MAATSLYLFSGSKGGTTLPTLRITKISPSPTAKNSFGFKRLSEQVINKVCGFCSLAKVSINLVRCEAYCS